MTTNTATRSKAQIKTICLSDYGLAPRMSLGDIEYAIAKQKDKFGEKYFKRVAKEVYFNLRQMSVGETFDYQQFFVSDKLDIFLVVAHRFIVDNMDYEFSNDYSAIRRTDCSGALALIAKQKARHEVVEIEE